MAREKKSLELPTVSIRGVPLHPVGMNEALLAIEEMVGDYSKDKISRYIATVNVDFLANALGCFGLKAPYPDLFQALNDSQLNTLDGMPLVWYCRSHGFPVSERVTGADLLCQLSSFAADRQWRIFLLGGSPSLAEQAAASLKKQRPDVSIVGVATPEITLNDLCDGTSNSAMDSVVEHINSSRPDVLFINFGNPKQELWYQRYREQLDVAVAVGVGGAFSFLAGQRKRAPLWMQRCGLEWLFRLKEEPRRLWKRYFIDIFKGAWLLVPAALSALLGARHK